MNLDAIPVSTSCLGPMQAPNEDGEIIWLVIHRMDGTVTRTPIPSWECAYVSEFVRGAYAPLNHVTPSTYTGFDLQEKPFCASFGEDVRCIHFEVVQPSSAPTVTEPSDGDPGKELVTLGIAYKGGLEIRLPVHARVAAQVVENATEHPQFFDGDRLTLGPDAWLAAVRLTGRYMTFLALGGAIIDQVLIEPLA